LTAKKKLAGAFGGIVAIGATVALTAGTFSYFSDSNSQQVGEVQFGTLDLVPQEGAASQQFTVSGAKPGDVLLKKTDFSFRNAGTMNGELRISFVPTHAAGTTDEQAAAFDDAVLITLAGVPGFVNGKAYTLDEVATATANGLRLATLGHGADNDWAIKGFPVTVTIDPEAGNVVQGVQGGFELVADLVQGDADGYAEYPDPSFPAAPATQP
jgi:hypothetical protein